MGCPPDSALTPVGHYWRWFLRARGLDSHAQHWRKCSAPLESALAHVERVDLGPGLLDCFPLFVDLLIAQRALGLLLQFEPNFDHGHVRIPFITEVTCDPRTLAVDYRRISAGQEANGTPHGHGHLKCIKARTVETYCISWRAETHPMICFDADLRMKRPGLKVLMVSGVEAPAPTILAFGASASSGQPNNLNLWPFNY